jgi:excisionase family DNA binding protein
MWIQENSSHEMLKVEEVAKNLKLSKPMIYKLISTGKIPFVKFGTAIRLTRNDVESFVERQRRAGGGKA